jgi:hypothetical protein
MVWLEQLPWARFSARVHLRRRDATQSISELASRALSPNFSLWLRFPIVAIVLADVLPMAVALPIQSIHQKGIGSYSAHLFVDVLSEVGYVKNATSIVQVRINQVFPKAFEQG